MKNYHRIASTLFNAPQLTTPMMMDLAVAWANQHLNLNIVNLPPAAQMGWDDDEHDARMAAREESRRAAIAESGIQTIPVHGLLVSRNGYLNPCETMTSYEQLRSQLNEALANPAVEHIVLDIDSPGGSATGAFELAEELYAARQLKPVTGVVNHMAYSGGYLLAAACSEIVLPPTGGVGSVGVIAKHLDISGALTQSGRVVTTIYAGAHKNDLSSTEPISDQSRAVLQQIVDEGYAMFTDAVARYRGLTVEAVRATEAGLYRGGSAVQIKFADRLETPQAVMNRIAGEVAASRNQRKPARRIGMQAAAMAMQIN